MISGCSADMTLLLRGAARLHSGLLTAAGLLGAGLGLLAAVLIHTFILKPRLLSTQFKGHDPWSLLEVEERDEDTEGDSVDKKTKKTKDQKVVSERATQIDPVNSEVAVFALKAKVIYPISQRFRPLADGASNPSLHEGPGLVAPPPEQDSASSSTNTWLSQDSEDDSSQDTYGPSTTPTFTFRREQHHPHTLCYTRAEGKVSLLCVSLQNLYHQTAELQQDKWSMFLQLLRCLFRENCALEPDLQQQEKEIEQLKKEACPDPLSREKGAEPGSVPCSIEEVEKAGRKKLEHTLQTALSFAKQLELLCQRLHSQIPNDAAQEMTHTLVRCLLLVEKQTAEIQASFIKTLCDRLQWWEELSGWLRIRIALLSQGAEIRMRLTTQSAEELTADGRLGFGEMERLISSLQTVVSQELQRCSDEVRLQMLELVSEHCRKLDVKKRKMMKAQGREWSHTLESHDQQRDAQQVTELMKELQVRHWKQRVDTELQWDKRVSDAVCELWKKLFRDFSRSLSGLWRECVLSTLTTSSTLSVEDCRTLLDNMELTLTNQIQQEEHYTRQHLHTLQEQLERDRQSWSEEEALVKACLKHFTNQHMKVVMATVARQRDIQDRSLIEDKQRLLAVELQRKLAAHHFYIQTVKEMQLTHLPCTQILQQEHLSAVETASEILQDYAQFLIGHALSQSARLRLVDCAPEEAAVPNDGQKERLKEGVCESVYVTPDSIMALIKNYYTQIHTVVTAAQHSRQQRHNKMREKQKRRGECVCALQRELSNWARKPHSAEFHRRVEQQKRRCLSLCEEEGVCEDPGQRTDLQHQIHTIREELRHEEDRFLSRLAALARVPLTDTQTNSHAERQTQRGRQRERDRDRETQVLK